jgi:hypothetical protein
VRDGIISAEQLLELLGESGGKTPAAEALVARGHLSPGQRARMVREQICEILWNAFGWREGSYRLLASPLTRRPPVAIDLFPGDLVLAGLRRTLTLEGVRADLPPGLALAPGAEPACHPAELTLSPWESSLLAHADGTKTVADLVLLSHADELAALAFLQGCRDLGLLDPVERVLSGTRRIGFM